MRTCALGAAMLAAPVARAHQPVFLMNTSKHPVILQAKPGRMQINVCLHYLDPQSGAAKAYPVTPHTAFRLPENTMVTIAARDSGRAGQGAFQILYPACAGGFNRDEFDYWAEPLVLESPTGSDGSDGFDLQLLPLFSAGAGPVYAEHCTPRSIVIFNDPGKAAPAETKAAAPAAPPAKPEPEEEIEPAGTS